MTHSSSANGICIASVSHRVVWTKINVPHKSYTRPRKVSHTHILEKKKMCKSPAKDC